MPIIVIRFGVKKLKSQSVPSRPTIPSVMGSVKMTVLSRRKQTRHDRSEHDQQHDDRGGDADALAEGQVLLGDDLEVLR